jgi:sarcosine oxidase
MPIASSRHDVVVIGAGVFGAWTAWHLQRSGRSVLLVDAYGAASGRASSGGETRVIRMGYGAEEIYTRWALRSLAEWQAFGRDTGLTLFLDTGVLWMGREADPLTAATVATLERVGVRHERLDRAALERRYPQIDVGPVSWALLEPESGVLIARRAVQAVVRDTLRRGAEYRIDLVHTPEGGGRLQTVTTAQGRRLAADTFVFACGPWLPRVFPALLGGRIQPTRQEVFFFGSPPADRRFAPPALPVWIDFLDGTYGMPDLENRGIKLAVDRHGPPIDPDTDDRMVGRAAVAAARRLLTARFPALRQAPLLETRVCQYENTSTGDFLLDRHPDFENVWLAGGGSGHGFKHGPAVGAYMRGLIEGAATPEVRFGLGTKGIERQRTVY